MTEIRRTQIPSNHFGLIKHVRNMYESEGIEIGNAFQKDAIQNCAGATATKKFKNWCCDISYKENTKGKFLVVEDSGTLGLIGRNYSLEEIRMISSSGQDFPDDERLARFSSLYNSSASQEGAGLYGIGKTMYAIASKDQSYFFDSLTRDGKYVANEVSQQGDMIEKALEDDDARDHILETTGFSPKESVGTRIIIPNPLDEIVESIENGQMKDFIQQSWWILINKLPEGSYISINGIPVDRIKVVAYTHKDEHENENVEEGYRIKRFGFFISETGENPLTDIYYYRKGMCVGKLDIKASGINIPERISGKYWGFVEVDEKWEKELAAIENSTHFGVNGIKKRMKCYQNLRNYVASRVIDDLVTWGYVRQVRDEDRARNQKLEELAKDAQGLFSKLDYPKLGTGSNQSDYAIRLFDVLFPEIDTIRVSSGDNIRFGLKITNNRPAETEFEYSVVTFERTSKASHDYCTGKTTIASQDSASISICYTVSDQVAKVGEVNDIVISVKPAAQRKSLSRTITFAYDCEKPITLQEAVQLNLHSAVFPRRGSRRINSGEYLTNVSYWVANNRNQDLQYYLKVFLHDGDQDKIMDVLSREYSIKPFEEQVINVDDIYFDQEVISAVLDRGVIELRAQIIASCDTPEYKRGQKIKVVRNNLFYNCDEKKGHDSAFSVNLSPSYPDRILRSWCSIVGDRQIFINSTHPFYKDVEHDEDAWLDYCREQILRQYVLIYWKEGRYEMFNINPSEIDETDPAQMIDAVVQQIEFVLDEQRK